MRRPPSRGIVEGVKRVRRIDHGTLRPGVKTPEGFLLLEGVPAKPGVYTYRHADGSVTREFVPPDELCRADSIATLARKPVTLGHPREDVTPANVAIHGVGDVDGTIDVDAVGGFVTVRLCARRADAIEALQGGIQQLSCGFACRLDHTPGEWNGQAYDVVQRDRVYNHLAIVPQGRHGSEVRVRLDAEEAVMDDREEPASVPSRPLATHPDPAKTAIDSGAPPISAPASHRLDNETPMKKILINGKEVEVSDDVAAAYEAQQKRNDEAAAQLATLTKERDGLRGQLTAEQASRKDQADQTEIQKRVDARVELLEVAAKVGVAEPKKLADAELAAAIVTKALPGVRLDGVPEAEVSGMLKVVIAQQTARKDHAAPILEAAAVQPGQPVTRSDADSKAAERIAKARASFEGRFFGAATTNP